MSDHTPGPWSVGRLDLNEQRKIFGSSHELVATAAWELDSQHPTMEANARLIAAAPDLLDAARAVVGNANHDCLLDAIADCRHAIAKAEGKA